MFGTTRIKSWPSPSYHPLEHPRGNMQQGCLTLLPPLGTRSRAHATRVDAAPQVGMGLHTRSASFTLSSSLRVKGLTWRSYI
jgi:hypothetical protein